MDARQQRGQEIAERVGIERRGDAWFVPSQSGAGVYRVTLANDELRCTCPDYRFHVQPCKHIYAAAIAADREATAAGPFHTTDGRYFSDEGDRRAHQRTLDARAARQTARADARLARLSREPYQ